jgi:glycosyltransferase involved in cell wall biosynthesis
MRRILFVQPSIQPPGGGNGLAAWMLQALAPKHRVTVLSWCPVETDAINRFFGTSLHRSDFDSIVLPRSWTYVPDQLPIPVALLRLGLMMRYTRRVSDGFDVIIGAHNEADYGRRGIQYVNYPTYFRPRPRADFRWYHRSNALLKTYYLFADWLAGVSFERMKSNLTLANSEWTAAQIQQFLGIEAQTVYPPVLGTPSNVPWGERQNGFLAVGRISPEKEYERVIRILGRVKAAVPDLTLTIVGTWDRKVRRYYASVRKLATSLGPWIQFRRNLSRDEVRALMAGHRYGIHGMREEHFGMAPAEMARAGMIVFVSNGGGQVEIVDREPALVYDAEDDAAEKIVHVLKNAAEQRRLREQLAARSLTFGTDRFMREVQAVVEEFKE